LPRHRTIPSSRSKAIALIAAGAFSVVGAASAAAATWPREPARVPARSVPALAGSASPASTDQLSRPLAAPQAVQPAAAPPATASTATGPQAVSLAIRAFQIHAAQASHAAAQWQQARQQAERRQAARRAEAAQDAAQAAQSQAAQSQAAAQSQVAAQPQQASTPAADPVAASGTAEQIAQAMLGSFGWSSSQFSCLYPLWAQESGWSVTAANPDGAYGIPQALPGAKMASAGPDWQTDAATQIRWGLEYIQDTYGSPCGAWDHEQATGWY
jgi:hypothetical protein